MSKVKSQVTMLMVIGLVIFITISLVLYLSKSAIKKQSQQNIKKTHETAIAAPVKEFVQKCLDKLAKDALVVLGKQGGYIYSSQGGVLVDYSDTDEGLFFVKYDNSKVAYNILPPQFSIPPYSSDIPYYPWETFPYETLTSTGEVFGGFFGISSVPPLNSSEGPNSLQTQIENFIDNNILNCMNFNIFEEQGFDIAVNSTKTSVIIGRSDLTVKSKIPITITNPTTKEIAEFSDFSTNIGVRVRDTYFFVKELIKNDIGNIRFNISDTKNNKDFIKVKLIKNIFFNDDLVIVTDEKSLIYGKPYEYRFGRRNRAPALYYLRNDNLEFQQDYQINLNDLTQGSELKAEDPDEDDYAFNIKPELPKTLNVPQIKFKIQVNDTKLSDYQVITVSRI